MRATISAKIDPSGSTTSIRILPFPFSERRVSPGRLDCTHRLRSAPPSSPRRAKRPEILARFILSHFGQLIAATVTYRATASLDYLQGESYEQTPMPAIQD